MVGWGLEARSFCCLSRMQHAEIARLVLCFEEIRNLHLEAFAGEGRKLPAAHGTNDTLG